jgi:predicted permease
VGVLPPLPEYPEPSDVYMPASACPFRARAEASGNRQARLLTAYGRLRPGTPADQARAELDGILAGFAREHPEAYAPGATPLARVTPLGELMVRGARPTLLVLLATVGLVLLIACANVANLSLARLADRSRELAVRAALGAGRRRLLRQLLTESTLLSLAGGVVGLALAAVTQQGLTRFAARFTARAAEVRLDGTVLLFTLAVSLVTGLAFGTLPGLPSAPSLASTAGSEGRSAGGGGRRRTRSVLVVSQLALSFTLLIGAALMLRSFAKLRAVDPGFQVENVLTMGLHLNWSTHTTPERRVDLERVTAFHDALLERVRAMPGVESAGNAWTFPLDSSFRTDGSVLVDGQDASGSLPLAEQLGTSPDYFRALGVPLLTGRFFDDADRGDASDAVIVNSRFVERCLAGGDPLGRRI